MIRDRHIRPLLALSLLGFSPTAGLRGEDRVLDRTSTARTFEVAPGEPVRLVVDNLFGRIAVRAHDAPRIEMRVETTVRGRSPEDLQRARREVSLDVVEKPGLVDVYVDSPLRDPVTREWSRAWRDRKSVV